MWVRVPEVSPSPNLIYMYYGNPSAASESDLVATMDRIVTYGGVGDDWLYDVTTDGIHVYAVGRVTSRYGDWDAVVVKLDGLMNVEAEVVLGGSSWEELFGVYFDGTSLYAVGYSYSCREGTALAVRLSPDLEVEAVEALGSGSLDYLYAVSGLGPYLYAVDYHANSTRPLTFDGLVVRMSPDLAEASGLGCGGREQRRAPGPRHAGRETVRRGDSQLHLRRG